MSQWITGGGTNSTQQTRYTGLAVQTSAQGAPVPIVWGKKRVSTNLIWYGDFIATPDNSKKGGKGGEGKGGAIYNYSTAVMLALCEGPITGIGTVWQDKTLTTLSNLGLVLFTGTAAQAAWAYLVANHPTQALTYAYTAYLANSSYQLGKSPNLPNHNFEVITPLSGSMPGTPDCNMADIIQDFLTNPQYSLNIPSGNIDATSLAFYKTYCRAQGFFFSPSLESQEQCATILDRWADLTNTWIFWSANVLKFVPLGDAAITNGTSRTVSVPTAIPNDPGPYTFTGIPTVTADGGVVFADGGGALTIGSGPGQYTYSAGVWTFNSADTGKAIVVTYTYTYSGGTYTPILNIVFNLSYEDFLSDHGSPPIMVTRTDPADAPNHVKLEIKDRNNAYNTAVAEWKDQGLIDQFGMIDASVTQAHEICDLTIGQTIAQLIGQRYGYIRNTYDFKIGWDLGCVLEPGDLVSLTDPGIGLNQFVVRIRDLDEDEAGHWSVTAEEYPSGIGTISGGTQQPRPVVNSTVNVYVAPGNVNPPAVMEPNSALTNGAAQLWVGASGGKNWGGCVVFISFDGVNYQNIGTISAPAVQGTLTANLADHADPDAVNTLSVDSTISNTAINASATHADADAFRTLSLVTDSFSTVCPTTGELLDYGTVSSTGAFTFNATYLRRALYGTSHALHNSGSFFTRIDLSKIGAVGNSVLVYNLPAQYIGVTIHLKLCSFNKFANSLQSLASVTDYTYTPIGTGYGAGTSGVPTTPTGFTGTGGVASAALTWNLNPTTDNVLYYKVFRAPGSGAAFGSATLIGTSKGNSYVDAGLAVSTSYTYFLEATNAAGDSGHTSGVNVTTSASPATVTSVGFADTSGTPIYGVTGSPITSSGTIDITLQTQSANQVFAGPTSGGAAQPTFRALVAGDLPAHRYDIDSWLYGVQTVATQIVRRFTAPRAISIPTTGHQATADTAATGSTTFTIKKNGVSAGTVNFAASATTGTFTISSPISLVAGDIVEIFGPATADATLAQINIILAGTA